MAPVIPAGLWGTFSHFRIIRFRENILTLFDLKLIKSKLMFQQTALVSVDGHMCNTEFPNSLLPIKRGGCASEPQPSDIVYDYKRPALPMTCSLHYKQKRSTPTCTQISLFTGMIGQASLELFYFANDILMPSMGSRCTKNEINPRMRSAKSKAPHPVESLSLMSH